VTSGLLLDTHILLWSRTKPEMLTAGEVRIIEAAHVRYVSCVTLWELAILMGLRRIEANERVLEVPEGYDLLNVAPIHCKAVARLPQHHRDPFDRMLIAQAQSEDVALLTRDTAMTAYASHATIIRYPEA